MRLTLGFILAAALLAPQAAQAQSADHPFGLGFYFGFPNGFSGKYWLDKESAVEAAIGWQSWQNGFYRPGGPVATVDWNYHFLAIAPRTPVVRFSLHAGAGGGLSWYSGGGSCYRSVYGQWFCPGQTGGAMLFARVPLGFSAYFPKVRLEASAEVIPSIRVLPDFQPVVMGGLAGRFYF